MSWYPLGTVTPSLTEWQLFGTPSFSELFRATYLGPIESISSFAWFRSYYATDEVSEAIRLYPKTERQIIESVIPEAFKQAGQVVRFFGVRKRSRYRSIGIAPDSNWQVVLEEWTV